MDNAAPEDPENFPFICIGNKTDVERKVSQADVDAWCAKNGNMTYIET